MSEVDTGKNDDKLRCSFCGKSQEEVKRLIAGPAAYICDECIDLCNDIILEESKLDETQKNYPHHSAKRVFAQLDEYVIGQEEAKKVLSVAVANHHWKQVLSKSKENDVELDKSNILLIGHTGVGKTHLARSLARAVDVTFAITDATAYTEAGYVGEDVETMLLLLLSRADYDVEKTEAGILYIDEIDKIARVGVTSSSPARDVGGVGVQQALLKMLEGGVVRVPPQGGRKLPNQSFIDVDTRDILFIAGGAFDGLETIIERRLQGQRSLASGIESAHDSTIVKNNPFANVTHQDLIEYGFLPEFVARFPIVVSMHQLTRDDLVRVLYEPRNALVKQYAAYFKAQEVVLEFDESALTAIASEAISMGLGARGLRAVLERTLLNVMFEIPLRKEIRRCKVTGKTVIDRTMPEFFVDEGGVCS